MNQTPPIGAEFALMFALSILVVAAVATFVWAVVVRRRFLAAADAIVRRLRLARPPGEARGDLPPEVEALARRLGAGSGATVVSFRQSGDMTLKLGGAWTPFTAQQVAAVGEVGFQWRARFGKLMILVVDDIVGDEARLEARLGGLVRLAKLGHSQALWRGEAMRYLCELIWNPDAILANRALRWRVVGDRQLAAATGEGPRHCEVTFTLDEAGDPTQMEAPDRPRIEGDRVEPTRWRGRAGEWREFDGRRIPTFAEVAWVIDGREHVYWRGRILSWSANA